MRVRWSRRRLSGRSAGSWHALPERTLSRAGRHCGAALTEAPAVAGRPVFVVGGGNSAGQAALHLAKYARQVTLLVRGPSLVDSMSDYLIEQIRGAHNVDIVDRVAVVGGTAVDDSLAEIEISHLDEGSTEVVPAAGCSSSSAPRRTPAGSRARCGRGLEVGAARAARWSGARIAVPAVFVFTTVTLVVTLVHLDSFHLDGDLPFATRAVTWAWLAIYAAVPVLMVAATVSQRRESI